MQNGLDFAIAWFFNQFVRRSWVFDQAVAFLSVNHLVKGGVLMAIFWWVWYRSGDKDLGDRGRDHMIATLLSCGVALAVARFMVLTFPYRERPLHEPALQLTLPYGVAESALDKLSSFPSDHATLFFALATGMFFVSRRLGIATLAYTTIAIALPRLYLGLHYMSDIVVGGLIGSLVAIAGNMLLPRGRLVQAVKRMSVSTPQFFYPVLFLVTYQIADLFENSRIMVAGIGKWVLHIVQL